MDDLEAVGSLAITIAKERSLSEVGPDELLLAALRILSRFGTATIGPWTFDLEEMGVDWLGPPMADPPGRKVAYSARAVELMDLAARVAKADAASDILPRNKRTTWPRSVSPAPDAVPRAARPLVSHLLVAFSSEDGGLMGELKRTNGIESASWRAALARIPNSPTQEGGPPAGAVPLASNREYLTPEEAADELGIHVQTLRAYVRSGKLPAARLAGERAIRIRRSDLQKVLEPLQPEKS